MMDNNNLPPVAIIGAGPVGLAAAAHLTLRNQPFILFEGGDTVGSNILSWKHIRVFSPWRYNVDKAARQLLDGNWTPPADDDLPTGQELYDRYLNPLAELPSIKPNIHLSTEVVSVSRKDLDKIRSKGREKLPFVIRVGKNGRVEQFEAKAIIDASGTWHSPNPVGSGGVYAIGEVENGEKIFYGLPDVLSNADRYKNKRVLVTGSGHSAVNVVLELDKLKEQYPLTEIHWVMRKNSVREVYGGQQNDELPARGALGIRIEQLITRDRVHVYTPFRIQEIARRNGKLTIIGSQHDQKFALPGIDEIISNTGSRPDFSFLREIRLNVDPSLESSAAISELIDPNIHSCGTVRAHGERELRHPEKDFYIAGAKSYGRAPTFLMATGYEQVRSIVAAIAGDIVAAKRVELDLPQTGVCSSDAGSSGCCGVAESNEQTARQNKERTAAACC
jgi:thioredoxin reductase